MLSSNKQKLNVDVNGTPNRKFERYDSLSIRNNSELRSYTYSPSIPNQIDDNFLLTERLVKPLLPHCFHFPPTVSNIVKGHRKVYIEMQKVNRTTKLFHFHRNANNRSLLPMSMFHIKPFLARSTGTVMLGAVVVEVMMENVVAIFSRTI